MDYQYTGKEISKIVTKYRGITKQDIEKMFLKEGAEKSLAVSIAERITLLLERFPKNGQDETVIELEMITDQHELDDIYNLVEGEHGIRGV